MSAVHEPAADEFDLDLRLGELSAHVPSGIDGPAPMTEQFEGCAVSQQTCQETCEATCPRTECGATCIDCGPTNQTCEGDTCETCSGNTCEGTCFGETCEATCAGTCGGDTCEGTCVTCAGLTCENNTCDATCVGDTCEGTCAGNTCEGTCEGASCITCEDCPTAHTSVFTCTPADCEIQ